jgi:hypothetical protein
MALVSSFQNVAIHQKNAGIHLEALFDAILIWVLSLRYFESSRPSAWPRPRRRRHYRPLLTTSKMLVALWIKMNGISADFRILGLSLSAAVRKKYSFRNSFKLMNEMFYIHSTCRDPSFSYSVDHKWKYNTYIVKRRRETASIILTFRLFF